MRGKKTKRRDTYLIGVEGRITTTVHAENSGDQGGIMVGKTHPNVQRQTRENKRLTWDESTVEGTIDQQEVDDGACAVDVTAGWFTWIPVQVTG